MEHLQQLLKVVLTLEPTDQQATQIEDCVSKIAAVIQDKDMQKVINILGENTAQLKEIHNLVSGLKPADSLVATQASTSSKSAKERIAAIFNEVSATTKPSPPKPILKRKTLSPEDLPPPKFLQIMQETSDEVTDDETMEETPQITRKRKAEPMEKMQLPSFNGKGLKATERRRKIVDLYTNNRPAFDNVRNKLKAKINPPADVIRGLLGDDYCVPDWKDIRVQVALQKTLSSKMQVVLNHCVDANETDDEAIKAALQLCLGHIQDL